jgi:hypothetical protein
MALKRYTFWIGVDQAAELKQIKTRDGIPEAEQLRRAIAAWIQTRSGLASRTDSRRLRAKQGTDRHAYR